MTMTEISDKFEIADNENTEEDPLKGDVKQYETKRNFWQQCKNVISNVTVEPCVLLFVTVAMTNINATQNLNLEKVCRVNLNYSDSICHSLKVQDMESENVYERETQKILTSAMTYRTYLSATIPCITALFIGSFSDKTGHRKFFIAVSVFGQVLQCLNSILNVYFLKEIGLLIYVFTDALIEGLTGSWCTCLLGCFSYISSIATENSKTYRMGLVNFSMTVAFPIGMGLSGVILKTLGYYGAYGFTSTLTIINLLYILYVLKDPPKNSDQIKHSGKGVLYLIRTFFDIKNVKYTMKVVYKKAPNNRRTRLCVLLAVVCVLFGPLYGEITVMYMITRYRFNWDEVQFSIFQTYNFITHTIGTMFCILVLSKYLQWHDSLLGIVSTLSKVAASFVYAFAPNERIFYVAPLIEILNGSSLLSMRAIITKLVEPNELGSISSIISLTENLMPLLYVPLYTQVYVATIGFLPGTVFLVGAGLTVPAVCVLSYLYYEHRKQLRSMRSDDHSKVTASYS